MRIHVNYVYDTETSEFESVAPAEGLTGLSGKPEIDATVTADDNGGWEVNSIPFKYDVPDRTALENIARMAWGLIVQPE